jgi:hypothetical protein
MSIVPTAPTLATAIDWSGSTSDAAMSSRLSSATWTCAATSTWLRPMESSQAWSGATVSSMFALILDRRDELTDRRREGLRHDEDHDDERDDDRGVDQDRREDPRQPWDGVDDARDDRADDEGQEPGEEQRQQDVAEVEEGARGQLSRDEEQDDRAEDEDRVDEPTLASLRPDVHHGG